jgi:hypothetical protein
LRSAHQDDLKTSKTYYFKAKKKKKKFKFFEKCFPTAMPNALTGPASNPTIIRLFG